jgi:hypothetical protein
MAEGCACRYAGDAEETAVIPVIGGPELVRPYIHPTEVLDDGPQDGFQAGYPVGYGAEAAHGGGGNGGSDAHAAVYAAMAQPPDSPGYGLAAGPGLGSETGSEAGYATQFDGGAQDGSGPPTVLHGTAVFPAQRRSSENDGYGPDQGTDVTPYAPGRRSVALRASAARGAVSGRGVASDRGGASSRGRRTAMIAAGALAVAGLGTAAALVPRMFGNSSDQSLPGPSVTLALPSTGADSPSAAASAAGASATAAPSRTRAATRPPSHSPTSRPSSAAASAPAQTLPPQPTASDSPPSSSPSSDAPSDGGDAQTLQRGDTGAAVATLQTELSDLWIDPNLTIDGRYGSRTERDVETFQSWYNVTGDPPGVFGPYSQAKMNQLAGR